MAQPVGANRLRIKLKGVPRLPAAGFQQGAERGEALLLLLLLLGLSR